MAGSKSSNQPSFLGNFFFLWLIAVVIPIITASPAQATSAYIEVDSCTGGNPATGPCFNPNDVTINVGDSAHWQHVDLTGSPHWIRSSDYEGRPCYDNTFVGGDTSNNTNTGNTDGLLVVHEDAYIHFFPAPGGDCYYRC